MFIFEPFPSACSVTTRAEIFGIALWPDFVRRLACLNLVFLGSYEWHCSFLRILGAEWARAASGLSGHLSRGAPPPRRSMVLNRMILLSNAIYKPGVRSNAFWKETGFNLGALLSPFFEILHALQLTLVTGDSPIFNFIGTDHLTRSARGPASATNRILHIRT